MDATLASVFNAWIMSPAAADKESAWFNDGGDAGTGPYRIAQYEPGQRMVLERFDDYWGGWTGEEFDKVVYRAGGRHDDGRTDAARRRTGFCHQPRAVAGADGQPRW